MGFVEAVKVCTTRKYATFSGRASRSEFWWFYLALALWYGVLLALVYALGDPGIVLFFLGLAVAFVPVLAVQVRRLHDTGKSGWLLLLALVPVVSIVLLVFFLLDSDQADNRYGPSPRVG